MIAFKRHMSYMPGQPIARDTRCPLCRGDDSQGHIFGSCMHPDMSKRLSESCQIQTTEHLSKQREAHSSRCRSLCYFGSSEGCSDLSELMGLSKQQTMQKGSAAFGRNIMA